MDFILVSVSKVNSMTISASVEPRLAKIPKVSIPVSIPGGIESESVSIKSIDTQLILYTRFETIPRKIGPASVT